MANDCNIVDETKQHKFVSARGTEYAFFARAYAPMIADSRLGDGEFRLLLWLGVRCCGKGESIVGTKAIAEDLGVSVRTVLQRLSNLRDLGWIRKERRGFGHTTRKLLADPEVVYGRNLLLEVPRLLKGSRTDQDVAKLRSIGAGSCTTIHAGSCTSHSAGSCTTEVDKEVEVDEVKNLPASQGNSDQGGTVSLERPGPSEDVVKRFGIADAVVKEAARKNRLAIAEKMKKKASRSSGTRPNSKKERITANDVEEWFKDEVSREFGTELKQSKWTLKEKSNAKLLLDSYGPELVEKTIRYVVRNWEDLADRLKVSAAIPSIGILTGYRDSIFGEVQVGVKRPKSDPKSGEYDPESAKRSPSAGWGGLAKRVGEK